MFDRIVSKLRGCSPEVCKAIIELAVEIAREGREGRRIGTLFTIGEAETVLSHSRPLILDPIAYHPAQLRSIWDENLRGTLKELAQLDVCDQSDRFFPGPHQRREGVSRQS
jgi:DNA integrity scanning protein DisA with diadenylate cyclase activity